MKATFNQSRMVADGSRALLAAVEREHGPQEPAACRLTVRGLVRHAARLSKTPVEKIAGKGRMRRLVNLRRAVAMVAREQTGADGKPVLSFPMIASALEGRDHSTIIHAVTSGWDLARRDPEFAWFVERLWAAAECDPMAVRVVVELEPEPEPDAPVEAAAAQIPVEAKPVRPKLVRLPVSVRDEYAPRHALPLTAAMLAEGEEPEDPADVRHARASGAASSDALRRAVEREARYAA